MVNRPKSRVPLWVRVLILLTLVPVLVAVYTVGQRERTGLFDASLMADTSPSGGSGGRLALPVYLPTSDVTLSDTIQSYDEDNLYKKINGHDVAFFRFGFLNLTFATYSTGDDAFIDVYAYRMNRRENALGIYASERSEEREPLAQIETGYRSAGGAFFYRGPFYVQIIPTANSPATSAGVDELIDSLLATLPAPDSPMPQLAWFPESGRVPFSEGFLPDNAFGTDFLGDVFTAAYDLGGANVMVFRHQSDSAAALADRYAAFLAEMASPLAAVTIRGQTVQRFSSYGEMTWLTASGNNIAGISGIPDNAEPTDLMNAVLENITSQPPTEPRS